VFKATIDVTLRQSVFDPQGIAVKRSLHALGFVAVADVRIGKKIEVILTGDTRAAAKAQVKEIAERVLSNPVMESFTFALEEVE
jgi:phosphoribosylformylglycinamidine synthase PurS subunit